MNDDLYLIVVGVGVLIPTLATLLGMYRETLWTRRIREKADQIGVCPECTHDNHPSFCTVMVGPRTWCGCDLMTVPEETADHD